MSEPRTHSTRVPKAIERFEDDMRPTKTQYTTCRIKQPLKPAEEIAPKTNSQKEASKVNISSENRKISTCTSKGYNSLFDMYY